MRKFLLYPSRNNLKPSRKNLNLSEKFLLPPRAKTTSNNQTESQPLRKIPTPREKISTFPENVSIPVNISQPPVKFLTPHPPKIPQPSPRKFQPPKNMLTINPPHPFFFFLPLFLHFLKKSENFFGGRAD